MFDRVLNTAPEIENKLLTLTNSTNHRVNFDLVHINFSQ